MAEDSGGQLELEPLPSSSSVEPAGCVAEGVGAGRSSSSGSKLAEAAQGGMESPVDAAGLEAGPSSISSSISSGALGLTDEQQQQGAVEAVGDGEGSGTSAEQEAAALPPPPRKHGMAAALFNVAQGRWKRVKNAMAGIKRHAPRKSIITLLVAAFNSSGWALQPQACGVHEAAERLRDLARGTRMCACACKTTCHGGDGKCTRWMRLHVCTHMLPLSCTQGGHAGQAGQPAVPAGEQAGAGAGTPALRWEGGKGRGDSCPQQGCC